MAPFAPGMGTPSLLHWNVSGPLPDAPAARTTVSNSTVETPAGCAVIAGGTSPRVTERFLNVMAAAKFELLTRQPK